MVRNEQEVSLPSTSKTTRLNILKGTKDLYTQRLITVYLPESFFGTNEDGSPIIAGYGTVIDPLTLIAESLTNVDADLFYLVPDVKYEINNPITEENKEMYRSYSGNATSQNFESVFNIVQERTNSTAVFPLCISINLDGVVLNKLGNKSLTPCYVRCANLNSSIINKPEHIHCVGYAPKLLFTNSELKEMMNERITSDGKKDEILKWLHLKIKQQYILEVASSIIKNQDNGITLCIGKEQSVSYHFIPIVFNFIGDSEEQNKICLIKCSPQTMKKCRMCSCTRQDMNTGNFGLPRNSNQLEIIGIEAEEAWIFKMRHKSSKNVDKNKLESARDESVYNCANVLNQLFRYQMLSNPRHTIYNCTPYDKLHTLYKGINDHCISWICVVIMKISKLDDEYSNSLATLDTCIKHFPRHNALNVFGNYMFHSGISQFLGKGEISESELSTMYLMSGSLEASKIPCLLFQLLISIGVDGTIVPNSTAWSRDNEALPRNPTDVIMKAGCMVLELV